MITIRFTAEFARCYRSRWIVHVPPGGLQAEGGRYLLAPLSPWAAQMLEDIDRQILQSMNAAAADNNGAPLAGGITRADLELARHLIPRQSWPDA